MDVLAQHPPAMKVGGRRLSVTSKSKTQTHNTNPTPATADKPADGEADYPRPADPVANEEPVVPPPHEDEAPKKKKSPNLENEHRLRDTQRKAEARPTREIGDSGKHFGGAGRIGQPAPKGM